MNESNYARDHPTETYYKTSRQPLFPAAGCFISIQFHLLFQFLLQPIHLRRTKKISQGDLQAVTQFFDGNAARILALSIQDAFHGRLRYAGEVTQSVGRNIPFLA